ncbi:MAG: putative lipid II flippase FtsW [Acidobacteria bacterium]|nr:putative lipid II flippase FtsW [Acidobacteriota bacterium]
MTAIAGGTPQAAARRQHPSARSAPIGRRSGPFILLLVSVTFLSLLGLLMVLSASSISLLDEGHSAWRIFYKQLMWLLIGAAGMITMLRFDYHRLRPLAVPLLVLTMGLMVLVKAPVIGLTVNGASRWVGFGELRVQPSELAKLFLILTAADFCTRQSRCVTDERSTLRPVIVLYACVAALLMIQPDFGTMLITSAIVAATLFVAEIPMKWMAAYGIVGLSLAGLLAASADYRRARFFSVSDPWSDELDGGYQVLQGLTAVANGGTTGMGLGAGRGKWGYLPFADSDFIFAVVAEELGFIGGCLVLCTLLFIGVLALIIALRAVDRFGRMIAAGIGSWILLQTFVNVGGVLNVLPVTGTPLPFVSYGGTSLIIMMISVGILLNIARQARRV